MTGTDPGSATRERSRIGRGRIAASIVVGALAGGVLWFFGVDEWFAGAIGCLIVAIGLTWAAYTGPSPLTWPREKPAPLPGTRSDVARLAWAFQARKGSVREPALRAVRELASRRLGRRGLDIDSPNDRAAVIALIGEQAYAALRPARGVLPSFGAVQGCVEALDALERSSDLLPGRLPDHEKGRQRP